MRLYVAVLVSAAAAWGCPPEAQRRSGQPPISSIEIDGGEAFAYLVSGVAARDVIGRDLFGAFSPGITPEQAAANLGPPAKIEKEGSEDALAHYEISGRRFAVVTRRIAPSGGGGPRTTAYELRTFPPSAYVERLPPSLRDLILKEPGLYKVVLVSDVSDDWNVRLRIRGQRLEYVQASPKSALRAKLPRSESAGS